jgi:LuxR family maltose regulon positive regulatory protein
VSGRSLETSRSDLDIDTTSGRPGPEIIASKLWSPKARPGVVVRSTLLERLDASRAPIVTVVAPGGYGKTTLLGQLVAREPAAVTTWLSLDEHDNDPAVLLSYLVAALERVEPIDAEQRRILLAGAADGAGSLRRIAARVSSMQTSFLIVIDHAEAVRDPVSRDLIAAVALNLPERSQLALASRTEPPIPLARLRAEGMVEEITRTELAMDEREAAQLLAREGTPLADAQLTELVAHTEGWPVGLYLASHVIAKHGSRTGPLRPPRGDDRDVADYLQAEFISSLPPSTVSLLIRTSILDRLSGPLCDAVMASTGSQQMLQSLESSNMLIVPLDRERHWYRCHHLLGEMLRAELERTEPEMVGRLHERASIWFEANGQLLPAVVHAQLAGDADRAALLFSSVAVAMHGSGRTTTVLGWLRWFEERHLIGRYPQVAALGAILEALHGGRASALLLADVAATGAADDLVPDGSTLGGWIATMEAVLCRRGVAEMRNDAARATHELSTLSPLRSTATALEGVAAVLQGDLDGADLLLAAGAELCRRTGNAPALAVALAERAVIALERGDGASAAALSEEALGVVTREHLESYVEATVIYAVAARTAAMAGQAERARAHTAAGARLRPRCTAAIPWSAQFLCQLALAYLALGDAVGARAVLRQVRDIMAVTPDLGALPEHCAEIGRTLDASTVGSSGASSLTAAELRLLPFLSTHLTYREIGERLYISRNTIKSEASSLYRKLGASSRSEAVQVARQIGLLGT